MSPFLVELVNVCRNNPDRPLLLLCPTSEVGVSWVRELQVQYADVAPPLPVTLLQLALSLAEPELAHQRLTLLSPEEVEGLTWEVWCNVGPELPSRVRDHLGNGPDAMYCLATTIQELRRAGLDSTNLDVTQFVNKERGRALHRVLEAYENTLRARKAADPMTVLLLAQTRLIGEAALPENQLLIVPDEMEHAGLLQGLLDQVPDADCIHLPPSCDALPLFSTPEKDVARLRWLSRPQHAPPPMNDGSVRILRVLSPEYEVRAVLGTLLRDQVPFDHAEVVYTDPDMYPRLFYETFSSSSPGNSSLPCTWGGGVPISWTRPGRALRLWCAWVEADYRAKELIELIVQDLLAAPAFHPTANQADLTAVLPLLRSMQGCVGRDAWRKRIAANLKLSNPRTTATRGPAEDSARHSRKEDGAPRPSTPVPSGPRLDGGDGASESTDQAAWFLLKALTEPLFDLLPTSPPSPQDAWTSAEALLTRYAAVRDAWDEASRQQGLHLIRHLRPHSVAPSEAAVGRLLIWINEGRLPAEPPQPGKLHLAPLATGGHSGRPFTFIVGMHEDAFPGPIERRSFLTDRDRRQLSPELARTIRPELLGRQDRRFQQVLDQLSGRVTFTYPCADQAEDCEVFPSQKLVQVYRLLSGEPEGDLCDFERWLPPPVGPMSPLVQLRIQDLWVQAWPVKGLYDPTLRQRFPHLPRGAFAAKERRQVRFTEYDGFVPRAGMLYAAGKSSRAPARTRPPTQALLPKGGERENGPVLSAGALQRLARCPLQFFFANVLGLTEAVHVEAGDWLNPVRRGEVLHNVFRDYHDILQRHKRKANSARDGFIVRQLLEDDLRKCSDRLPVVPEHVRNLEINELHEVLMMFVSEEAKLADEYEPIYFEASLGLPSLDGHQTAIDTDQPIALRLPSGRTLFVHGRVDRVDRLRSADGGPRFFVWDYKTGSINSFMGEEARRSGQVLQPLLYLEMLEQRLRAIADPDARVEGVGYFFPGQRGQGDRLAWTAEQLREHARALDLLLDLLQAGTFLATERKDVCPSCGYQGACDLALVNDQAKHKRHSVRNQELLSLRLLRDPNTRAKAADVD